ncbi:MAG TPA: hypothetical protein PLF31_02750 [Candidatus Paceibacterota bacterium]|nr:hypothetical protein [Candidatus Paceibacterota bacterium]
MIKFIYTFVLTVGVFGALAITAHATEIEISDYVPLAGSIPGVTESIRDNSEQGIGPYIQQMYTLIISLSIVLAVIMFIWNGFKYATSDILPVKSDAKEGLKNVILGLLLVLGAYLILFTIDPYLTRFEFGADLPPAPNSTSTAPTDPTQVPECDTVRGSAIPTSEGVFLKTGLPCKAPGGSTALKFEYKKVSSYEMLLATAAPTAGQEWVTDNACEAQVAQWKTEHPTGVAMCAYRQQLYVANVYFDFKTQSGKTRQAWFVEIPYNAPGVPKNVCEFRAGEYTNPGTLLTTANRKLADQATAPNDLYGMAEFAGDRITEISNIRFFGCEALDDSYLQTGF